MSRFLQRSGIAFAALLGAAAMLDAQAQPGQLPPEHQAGAVSYVSGGVGEDQAHRFEAAFKRYPLVVRLFEGSGTSRAAFTAQARVTISDARGRQLLDTESDGPYLLARLPAGDYRIGASLGGRHLPAHRVRVTDGGHAATTFVFPKDAG